MNDPTGPQPTSPPSKPIHRATGAVDVLQVIPELDPGGAETVLYELARLLPRERFRVSVAALDGRGAMAERLRAADVAVHDLGLRARPVGVSTGGLAKLAASPLAVARLVIGMGPAARRLGRLMAELRPAVVHSHLMRAHLATAQALEARRGPRRRATETTAPLVTVATEHQADPRRWALAMVRRATRRFSAVTAVSEAVRAHLVSHGFAPDRVFTIDNGIDLEAIDRATPLARDELGLPGDAQVALFVGRLTHQKGLDVLAEAMRRLTADHPRLHLLVAGPPEDARRFDPLRDGPARAREWGLEGRVHFLGRRDDVPRLLKTADVVALPSRWEGLSLVLLEAMAAGRAVVATRVEGHAETVVDGESGLLVPAEDAAALASAMACVLADGALARHLGEGASRVVRDRFPARAMADRYAVLYGELLSRATEPDGPVSL